MAGMGTARSLRDFAARRRLWRSAAAERRHRLGRWTERWRFRRLALDQWPPRSRALCVDPLVSFVGVDPLSGAVPPTSVFEEVSGPPEVDPLFVRQQDWRVIFRGTWRHTGEHITVRAARTVGLVVRCMVHATQEIGAMSLAARLKLCVSVGCRASVIRRMAHHEGRICRVFSERSEKRPRQQESRRLLRSGTDERPCAAPAEEEVRVLLPAAEGLSSSDREETQPQMRARVGKGMAVDRAGCSRASRL